MYSEVVFGCPTTHIKPSRGTSTPTEIMFVAKQISTGLTFSSAPYLRSKSCKASVISALSIRLDGTVSWPHTARPTGNTGPAEFLIKSSAAIEFPLAAFEAGLVLDKKDILALSHAPMTTLWTANEHGRIQVRETVDAASQSFLSATGADRSTALRPAAWYAYLCYDHTLKSALDAYLFSIDPRFTEHGEFAMFALANRLANEPVEGTCEIPNVPELQTASAR